MRTRLMSCVALVVLLSAVTLVPGRGVAQPGGEPLAHLPVQGRVAPAGSFVGELTIVTFSAGDASQLLLTGVLNGTATLRGGAQTQVTQQTFTAPATLSDSDRTTDVVLLKIAPIALTSLGMRIRLAQITVDIYDLPNEGDVLVPLPPELS